MGKTFEDKVDSREEDNTTIVGRTAVLKVAALDQEEMSSHYRVRQSLSTRSRKARSLDML